MKNATSSVVMCCPYCLKPLARFICTSCHRNLSAKEGVVSLIKHIDGRNRKTIDAYKLYSQFYAIIALLTYWIVWRGKLNRHIRFFREALLYSDDVLDLATGDGTLTRMALCARFGMKAKHLVALDISDAMLNKAKKKLPSFTNFVKADIDNLPFLDNSIKLITCFGGFNSFPSGLTAMREISRILQPGGTMRGSFLLMPQRPWKQKLVRRWIEQGYQTCELTLDLFDGWVNHADFHKTKMERHGDVILFEVQKPNVD